MSFTNYVPPLLTPEQSGAMPDILGKILSGYTQTTNARYLKPSLDEALKKAQLANIHAQQENQYYAPNIESQIGLRKAQTGQARSSDLHLQKENQYYATDMESQMALRRAQIEQAQAQAQKARLIQALQQQLLGINPDNMQVQGQSGGEMSQSAPQMGANLPSTIARPSGNGASSGQEQYALSPEQIQRLAQAMPPPKTSSTMPNADYGKVSTAMQMLGLGKPQIVQDANGKYVAITPFGNIDTGASTLDEQGKALAKEDAKKISGLEDKALTGYEEQDTLDALNGILGSNQFEQMRQHPVYGKYELKYYSKYGTPEQQKMVGDAQAYMGKIVQNTAQHYKGSFRVGEQALIMSMKPSENDSLDVMKGKAEALTYMNQMLTKRSELMAQYMREQKMSPLQAKLAVDKTIKPSEIKKQVNSILYPPKKTSSASSDMVTIRNKKTGETISVTRDEARKRGLNV